MKSMLIIGLSFIMIGFNNCVVADIPDEVTHNIQISGQDLEFLAGRCFDENFSREEFLTCLELDLEESGFTTLQ